MKTETARDLETSALIRLWFRLLWQKYDLGGISVGRSLRCDLLDCYLDFTPIPSLALNADDYYEGLEQEILEMRSSIAPHSVLSFESIAGYAKEQVALAGLGALMALEFSVSADVAWKDGYELERKRIKMVLEKFPFIEVPPTLEIHEVARALLARKNDLQYEDNRREFEAPVPDDFA